MTLYCRDPGWRGRLPGRVQEGGGGVVSPVVKVYSTDSVAATLMLALICRGNIVNVG